MSYKEFTSTNERVIVRNSVQFRFLHISEYEYLIEVSIRIKDDGEYLHISNVVTTIEAYSAYENILNGGLE